MLDGRKRTAALVTSLIALGAVVAPQALPASAEPDLETVQAKVDRLYHQAEQASERYNAARIRLDGSRERLGRLDSALKRQQRTVRTMREQVAAMVVDQYQNNQLSTAAQVVLADDPDDFIDNLTAISAYNTQRAQVMADYTTQVSRLGLRQQAMSAEVADRRAVERRLASAKRTIDTRAATAKGLLDRLEAEERARLEAAQRRERQAASRSAAREAARAASAEPAAPSASPEPAAPSASSEPAAPSASPEPAASSGRAGAAVSFALAQVGKSYVYGAAGPSAFDCSGLTMMAWAQAGVSLPHQSGVQMASEASVSTSQLQPGDLVFYYSPVSHVGLYIGNGQVVSALNPSAGIHVHALNMMPISGAVRPS